MNWVNFTSSNNDILYFNFTSTGSNGCEIVLETYENTRISYVEIYTKTSSRTLANSVETNHFAFNHPLTEGETYYLAVKLINNGVSMIIVTEK